MAGELRRSARGRTAASGEEALAACLEREPEIMLLDLRLPGMNGLEVLKAIPGAQGRDEVDHADRPRFDRHRH